MPSKVERLALPLPRSSSEIHIEVIIVPQEPNTAEQILKLIDSLPTNERWTLLDRMYDKFYSKKNSNSS